MVRLAHYMGIVHPGGASEVSTTKYTSSIISMHARRHQCKELTTFMIFIAAQDIST